MACCASAEAACGLAAMLLSTSLRLQSGPTLLERLGLPNGAVRNVVMNNDIVPRAFACDYTLVANLLARVGEGFRGHACLQNPNGRKVRSPECVACCAHAPPAHLSVSHAVRTPLPGGGGGTCAMSAWSCEGCLLVC